MIRIALTGSIGMGKSTVARMFEQPGVPVFDADAVVRALQAPGGGLVEKIGELFPGAVRSGTLDRECLAHIVLADRAKLTALEQIVHPAVQAARDSSLPSTSTRRHYCSKSRCCSRPAANSSSTRSWSFPHPRMCSVRACSSAQE